MNPSTVTLISPAVKVTLTRTARDITVTTGTGELGTITGRPGDYEAAANLKPANGFGRELVASFKRLRDAIAFITENGVA